MTVVVPLRLLMLPLQTGRPSCVVPLAQALRVTFWAPRAMYIGYYECSCFFWPEPVVVVSQNPTPIPPSASRFVTCFFGSRNSPAVIRPAPIVYYVPDVNYAAVPGVFYWPSSSAHIRTRASSQRSTCVSTTTHTRKRLPSA